MKYNIFSLLKLQFKDVFFTDPDFLLILFRTQKKSLIRVRGKKTGSETLLKAIIFCQQLNFKNK